MMINEMVNNIDCCGCKVCKDECPVNAIDFEINNEGFWYPYVDLEKCIKCKKCLQVCPGKSQQYDNKYESICYGAWSLDYSNRMESTSGGIFFELARYIIKEGGICYGACYDGMEVKHSRADTIEKLKRFRRSKYVQSDTDGIFKEVKKDLDEGKKVLFSGTPCQCVALKNYIKCDLNNLYTVDFICCGVPSPMVYKSYIDFLQKKYCSKIVFIWFKNKRLGWNNLGTLVHFENGKEYFRTGNRDYYMTAYVKDGLDLRLSCYNCQYRTPSHQTDITLGDFWGVKNYKKIDDREGISAVIINSEKGKELFDRIKGAIECFDADINQIKAGNFTLYKSKDMNEKRSEFFAGLSKEGLKKQMIRYGSYKGIKKIIIDIKFFVKYCLLKRRA